MDLQRHTDHKDYYARNPSTDGRRIVYHAGGALYLFDPAGGSREIPVRFATARAERQRHFVDAGLNLQGFDPHPKGHSLAVIARGRAFTFGNWEGAARCHLPDDGARRRLARWLHDGEHFVCVSDATGEEALEVHVADGTGEPKVIQALEGRVDALEASPVADRVVLTNDRNELITVTREDGKLTVLDHSDHGAITGPTFSPDGRFVAYAFPTGFHTQEIRVVTLASGEVHTVTRPVLQDSDPAWDPKGKWLYFLSSRTFDPVYDGLHFDLGFPKGEKPYALCLRPDVPSPFVLEPRPLKAKDDEEEKDGKGEARTAPRPRARATTPPTTTPPRRWRSTSTGSPSASSPSRSPRGASASSPPWRARPCGPCGRSPAPSATTPTWSSPAGSLPSTWRSRRWRSSPARCSTSGSPRTPRRCATARAASCASSPPATRPPRRTTG